MTIAAATSCWTTMDSPLGQLVLASDGTGLTQLSMGEWRAAATPSTARRADEILDAASTQLTEYFGGRRRTFALPLRPAGSDFQRLVWLELTRLPFGTTANYAEIARRIGRPTAVRAVARANATNPLGIVVPCHRVIAANGGLSGYAGGLERKAWLLAHEGVMVS